MPDFILRLAPHRALCLIEHNGNGAFDRVSEEATAFGHRGWPYNFLITTMWSNPVETEANISLTREFFAAMRPYLADAAYVNYFCVVKDDALRAGYGRHIRGLRHLWRS